MGRAVCVGMTQPRWGRGICMSVSSQGSGDAATLGYKTESRWDIGQNETPCRCRPNPNPPPKIELPCDYNRLYTIYMQLPTKKK